MQCFLTESEGAKLNRKMLTNQVTWLFWCYCINQYNITLRFLTTFGSHEPIDIVTVGKSASHFITPHHCEKDRLFPSPFESAKTGGLPESCPRPARASRKKVCHLSPVKHPIPSPRFGLSSHSRDLAIGQDNDREP
jgi:hypothetical protein